MSNHKKVHLSFLKDSKVHLTYYKNSGKWYADGSYYTNHKQFDKIVDELRAMKILPGLIGKWPDGIVIECQGLSCLLPQGTI